jgi:hypothetical protein
VTGAVPAEPSGGDGGSTPVGASSTVVTNALEDQAALESMSNAPVSVRHVLQDRKDVLVVPVPALLALAEGGYGVEAVDGDTSHIVAVQVGLFAAGFVEISGPGIEAGTKVGMPR